MFAGMYMKLIAAAIIVAAVLGAVWYVKNLQGKVDDLEKALVVCEAQGNVLAAKIEEQNASVLANKAAADKRIAEADKLTAAAQAETVKAVAKAKSIYKRPPSVPGKTCEADRKSTLDLLNGVAP